MSKSLRVLAATSVLTFGMSTMGAAFAYECSMGSKTVSAETTTETTAMEDGKQALPPKKKEI